MPEPGPGTSQLRFYASCRDGHVYRIRALDAETKRIIGKVQVHVDVDAEAGLQHYLGSAGVEEAEKSARSVLENLIKHRYGDDYARFDPAD